MPASKTRPERYFHLHGLSATGLHETSRGFVNRVWMTDDVVLRLSRSAHHAREAQVACAALAAGVRTARPLFWGRTYSLWQRIHAQVLNPPAVDTWDAVLDDLEKLHAHPPFPAPRQLPNWMGRPELIAQTQEQAHWTAQEVERLNFFLGTEYPTGTPVFIHGDVYHQNILVTAGDEYVALIDWGNARWATLEHEAASIENLSAVQRRWGQQLDWRLLWRVRLELLLFVASVGRVPFTQVREALRRLETLEVTG